jgi:hypothetical protein
MPNILSTCFRFPWNYSPLRLAFSDKTEPAVGKVRETVQTALGTDMDGA